MILPILLGIIPFALIVGVTGVNNGLSSPEVIAMSLLVFAGTSQLAAIELINAEASLLVVIFTGMVINVRFLMYSASVAPYLKHLPVWKSLPLAYFLTDQVYAVSISRFPYLQDKSFLTGFYLSSGVGMWFTWQSGTIAGTYFGKSVPEGLSLEFAIPLVFIALLVPVIKEMKLVISALVAGLVAVVGYDLSYNLGLVLGAVSGIGTGLILEAKIPENKEKQ